MKMGHVVGTRKHRTPRRATQAQYAVMGAAIAKKLEGKTVEELLSWKIK